MTEEFERVEEKPKPPSKIAVNIVAKRGMSAVVEWVDDGKAFRKTVPLKDVKDGEILESVLKKSPDYGVPWAKEVDPNATPEDIEVALHNAGIWTAEDALRNPAGIKGAINAAYKSGLVEILQAAKKYKDKE